MNRNAFLRWWGVVAAGVVFGLSAAFGQFENPVKFTASVEPAEARRGESVTLTITAVLGEGWHLYALPWSKTEEGPIPTTLAFKTTKALKRQGSTGQSKPTVAHDPNFEMDVQWFAEKAVFTQKFRVADDAPMGKMSVEAGVNHQLCTESVCLPPRVEKLTAEFVVTDGKARPEYVSNEPMAAEPVEPGGTASAKEMFSRGLWSFLLLAIGAGLLSVLTPCVFPMIPLTVSFFTNQADKKNSHPVVLAFAYCFGIVTMFTLIGIILSVALGPGGPNRLAANPFINSGIAIVLGAFALSLFGLFELQLPSGLTNFMNQKSTAAGGYVGAILMGFTFTLVAFACTAPFVGTVLVSAATGAWLWPIIGMIAYSGALASPFFFLALFPRMLAKLPRSGGWMNSIKVVMGFIVVAAAFKFLTVPDIIWGWGVFTRPVLLLLWTAVSVVAALYLFGLVRFKHETKPERLSLIRIVFGLIAAVVALYLATGVFGRRLHPTLESYLPTKDADHLTWMDNLAEAKAQSAATGRPIFVDFTGYTCTNCRWMEQNIFVRPEIEKAFEKFVRVRLHTDAGQNWEANQNYQIQKFGTPALPFYAIIDANEEVLGSAGGTIRNPQVFLDFLQTGLRKAGTP